MFCPKRFRTLLATALLLSAPALFASETESRRDTVTLDELSVVAVKQRPDLQQMPLSSTSIGQNAVRQLDISDLKGTVDIVPNFFIPDYGSRITSSIYVRGIGARMDQPAVGLNVDNVPILNKDAYDLDIADIADVEMLRGPQSSLFGRNTMTGLINIRTISPLSFQGWRVMAQYGSGNSIKASAGWYGKLTPDMALSATGAFTYSDGLFRNEYNGRKIDKERSGALRIRYEWRTRSGLRLSNVLSASILRQGGYPYAYLPTGKIAYNDTCFYRRFLLTDGLTLAWRTGNVDFLSVTSLQHIDDNMTLDQDFLPESYFTLTQKKRETSVTEDIMARGRSGKYRWLAGVFAFYRDLHMQAPVTFKDEGIRSLIESHRNEVNHRYPIRWDSRSFPLNSDFTMPSAGVALYHESRLGLGRWELAAGLRLDFEHVGLRYNSYCDTGYDILDNVSGTLPPPADTPVYRHVPIKIDDSGRLHRNFLTILPKVSALYRLPDSQTATGNLYATIGKGYKAGGFNTQMFSDVLQQRLMNIMGIGSQYALEDIVSYKPEECWSYELGTHLDFPSARLTADLSVFYIDIRNQQLTMFPDGTTTGRIMTNAGKTRSCGLEISLNWRPLDGWTLTGSYGHTDVRFREYSDGRADYKGKFLPYAPQNTLWLQSLYSFGASWLKRNRITVDVNLRGNGKIYWNEQNTREQPLYFLLGASLTFHAPKWEVQVWGRNLTDTHYDTFYFLSMGNEFLQRGDGITFGATFRLTL